MKLAIIILAIGVLGICAQPPPPPPPGPKGRGMISNQNDLQLEAEPIETETLESEGNLLYIWKHTSFDNIILLNFLKYVLLLFDNFYVDRLDWFEDRRARKCRMGRCRGKRSTILAVERDDDDSWYWIFTEFSPRSKDQGLTSMDSPQNIFMNLNIVILIMNIITKPVYYYIYYIDFFQQQLQYHV